MSLTREQILQADDLRHMDVEVPEWGGTVRVRVATARERAKFQQMIGNAKGNLPDNFMEKFVATCTVDEKGKPLFPGPDDIKCLSEKSAVALTKVFNAAAELNGMTEGSVEEIEGE